MKKAATNVSHADTVTVSIHNKCEFGDFVKVAFAPYGYAARYALRHPHDVVRHYLYEVKYFLQRGWRGYSDRDLWSLDYYLARVLQDALPDLADRAHTYIPQEDMTDEEAMARSDEILRKIGDGFKAANELCEQDFYVYSIPPDPHADLFLPSDPPDSKFVEMNPAAMGELDQDATDIARLAIMKRWEEGIDLFKKYYFDLWD